MQLSPTRTPVPDPGATADLAVAVLDASYRPTVVPGMTLYAETAPTLPIPVLFEPVLYFPIQGRKRLLFDNRTIDYGAGELVVCGLHTPALAQVVEASTREPYLAVELRLVPVLLVEMVRSVLTDSEPATFKVHPAPVAALDPLLRLVRMAHDPVMAAALADGVMREVLFHVLDGPQGTSVAALANGNSVVARVGRATLWMTEHLDTPVDVERLARHLGMSASSLHRKFKTVTGTTPAAFHKQLRLHEARRLGLAGNDVAGVAHKVGYVSPSQFSRDYKNLFGTSPAGDFADLAQHRVIAG